MEPDANGFYAMPTAPPARSFSRDRSPQVMMAPARSTSRQRRTSMSQERPTSLYVHEGASGRHRGYHLTGPAPGPTYHSASPVSGAYQPSASMGRSLSVTYNTRPTSAIRATSTGAGNVTIAPATSRRNSNHARSASGAGVQYYYGANDRRKPVSYYSASASHWDGSAGSYGSYTGEWDEWTSTAPSHSPVGSYSRSPTRNPYEISPPTAPQPPLNAYRAEEDLVRLEQARMELEHLRIRERDEKERGRTAERRLREIRTQASADPRLLAKVTEAEKQAAIAIAQREEYERKLAEAEARAARLEKLTAIQSKKPQVILQNGKPLKPALKQTVAVTQNTGEASTTAVNQNMGDQAPPKNPQDYQAKIPKDLISRAALVEKGLTYEEHKDYLLVKRYLSKEDIKALLDRTAEIRKQRDAVDRYKAAQAAAAAKIAEEKERLAVHTHTTKDGKNIAIVTMPQKDLTPPPAPAMTTEDVMKKEWEEWQAEKAARAQADEEWARKMKANEQKFKHLVEQERREKLIKAEMERQRKKATLKLQRKGLF
ncbi:hypothetical protein H072_3173 [Dactylellina haptotyla CBS 200.50]|uniref:DUF8035 domain-containing protein n=1 Tax=Dactylellina haptotyla (strain CBS 200.50) TaxID=1284197 RepID=S8BTV0_DACHA|nr:hypothetical protein H072_3173 [Dactylellina haptotyla CBS 200.50]